MGDHQAVAGIKDRFIDHIDCFCHSAYSVLLQGSMDQSGRFIARNVTGRVEGQIALVVAGVDHGPSDFFGRIFAPL